MRPSCYNRPPRPEFYKANDGYSATGQLMTRMIPVVFEDRCATHDGVGIGPNNENYPTAHGFDCSGCRWNPQEQK